MSLLDKVLNTLPEGEGVRVYIGLHWTAVVVKVDGQEHCGLASTLGGSHVHGVADIPQAGQLESMSALELASLARSEKPISISVGVAAINALIPKRPETFKKINAAEVIAEQGKNKSVALIGHFPFVPKLRRQVGELNVLEQNPRPGDLPENAAEHVLPKADVVAITGMTLLNHTLDDLLKLCKPQSLVILLGPSTYLSPVLFDYGIDLLCGAVVADIDPVLQTVAQAGNFRQVHHAGVQLVTMERPGCL